MMLISEPNNLDFDFVVSSLRDGQTIVYPTETCYGLGCDATNEAAVNQIFAIKQRPLVKPLLVVGADAGMMMDYVEWGTTLEALANKYWPGPLTVVAPIKVGVRLPTGIIGPANTLAFRVTSHPIAAEISRRLGKPIVSTSANLADLGSPYDGAAVIAMFQNSEPKPDIIIDAGELPYRSPSTIVKILNGKVAVLRQGEVVVEL